MKKYIAHLSKPPLRWFLLVVVMLMGVLTEVHATSTFYYNATVNASPRAAGRVYITSDQEATPTYTQSSMNISESQRTVGYGETTLYMYARAQDNYLFSHWLDGSGAQVGTIPSYNTTVQYRSTNSGSPTTFTYTAVFVAQQGLIKVKSADESMGFVGISNPNNVEHEMVTLTAYPYASNGMHFLGWTKDGGTEYVSTQTPLVLEANSETKGTYTAHFKAGDKVFVRMQNKKTGRFICFYGDNNGRGASMHTRNYNGDVYDDGFKFDNCWKLIPASEAQGNPETVFKRTGEAQGAGVTYDANLTAHDSQFAYMSLIHETNSNAHMLTMEQSGDFYYIYTTFKQSGATMRSYFCDEGTDWLVMKSTQDLSNFDPESAQWYVYILNSSTTEGALGANTKEKYTMEGKYYTTMYTDFAYQCYDDVKAYYLKGDETSYDSINNVVHFAEVPGGKVPANMAVVLECPAVQNDFASTKTVLNRLVPLTEEVAPIINEGAHFLKGYVSVNNSNVPNNKETMYVLSIYKHLGFYPYSKDNMTPNKAYLDTRVSTTDDPKTASVKFAFGTTTVDPGDIHTPTNIKGDMNDDGVISIADVMILVSKITGQ